MEEILVLSDFSECSKNASLYAIGLAKQTKASVHFLHNMHLPLDWLNIPEAAEEQYPEINAVIEKTEKNLEQLVLAAKEQGLECRKTLSYSDSNRSIIKKIANAKHDLIVMGAHGQEEISKFIIGSNTAKIMRTANAPVVVVSKLPEKICFDTLVYASGLEQDTYEAFDKLIEIASPLGVKKIYFLEVTTPYNFKTTPEILDKINLFISRHESSVIKPEVYNHKTIEAGILEFSKNNHCDLLSIANHGRTDLTSLFIYSIPENLVKYTDTPLLSIRI
jgi:nucleotide-binding universal stress UspA family protein